MNDYRKVIKQPDKGLLCPKCGSEETWHDWFDYEADISHRQCDKCGLEYKICYQLVYDYTEYKDEDN